MVAEGLEDSFINALPLELPANCLLDILIKQTISIIIIICCLDLQY